VMVGIEFFPEINVKMVGEKSKRIKNHLCCFALIPAIKVLIK